MVELTLLDIVRVLSLEEVGVMLLTSAQTNEVYTGLSKLANILFSRQLQKNFDTAAIDATSIALHPGLIKTGKDYKHLYSLNED